MKQPEFSLLGNLSFVPNDKFLSKKEISILIDTNNQNNTIEPSLTDNMSILLYICQTYIKDDYIKNLYKNDCPNISYRKKNIGTAILYNINCTIVKYSIDNSINNSIDTPNPEEILKNTTINNKINELLNQIEYNQQISNYTNNLLLSITKQLITANQYYSQMKLYRKKYNLKVLDVCVYQLFNMLTPSIKESKISQIYRELNYGPNSFHNFIHRGWGIDYIKHLQSKNKFSLEDYVFTLPIETQNQFFLTENPTLESQIKQDYENFIKSKYPPFISYEITPGPSSYTINSDNILSHLNSLSDSQLSALTKLFIF